MLLFTLSLFVICALTLISILSFMSIVGMGNESMKLEIDRNDKVIIARTKQIERFEIVAVEQGDELLLLRVVGLPGESIEYKNDRLYVNGHELAEKYLEHRKSLSANAMLTDDFKLEDATDEETIPENAYFLLGDNRKNAKDSREFGIVKKSQIKGVVTFRIWPLAKLKQY